MTRKLLLCCCLLSLAAAAQPRIVTLDEMQRRAAEYGHGVRIARAGAEKARAQADMTSASRLPRLDASFSYTRISETGKIDLQIPGIPLPVKTISFGDGNVADAAVTLSAPLFAGFRLDAQNRIARENSAAAATAADGAAFDARCAAARLYYGAVQATYAAGILESQRALLAELLHLRRALTEQGQGLAFDTLLVSTRMLQLDVEATQARHARATALLSLAELTGATDIGGVDTTDLPPPSALPSAEVLIAMAAASRADLLVAASAQRSAELGITAAESSMYPTVAAVASLHYARPGVDQIRNEWMDYYTAGVKMEWNLWAWSADKHAIEKAQLEERASALRVEQVRNRLETSIRTLLLDLDTRAATIGLLERQIQQERARLDIARARLREGTAIPADVLDAETALTRSLLQHAQTRIEYLLKRIDLVHTVGREIGDIQ